MLCCGRQGDEYELNEGESDMKNKPNGKAKPGNKKKGDNKKVKEKKGEEQNEVNEVVEAPVEIKVTEAVEAEPSLELSLQKETENQTESGTSKGDDPQVSPIGGKGGNPQFASQMSFTSQSSIREDIYRSREKFFTSSHPFDESLSQGDRRSVASTDERFAAHQIKIRNLVQPVFKALEKAVQEDEMSAVEMKAVVDRLESVAMRLESLATIPPPKAAGGSGSTSVALAPFVAAFEAVLKGSFAKFLELSNKIGDEVQTQAQMVETAFKATKDVLVIASKSKKPGQADLSVILKPVSDQISAIQQFREDNRRCQKFNHLSGISESIPALGWVAVEPTPKPYVKEMQDAGMFYTNRVLKDHKGVDGGEVHCDWSKKWIATLTELQDYIKEHHTTGLTWNPQGGDAKSAAGSAGPPPPSGGGPPPPPPPPPVELAAPSSTGGGGEDVARAQLFSDLNKGAGVTSGLKKVTDDMKTHKNPNLRAQSTTGVRAGPAPFKAANTAPKPAPKPTASAVKPPVFELVDKKWVIEYNIGRKDLEVTDTNPKQVVYIYKCNDSVIQIKGKVNSIAVDSCKKVDIVFEDVVSSIEFINSQSVKAQVLGKCPTVSIDKTDGCMVYLSKDSTSAEIVTAKSSEMNILVPNDQQDFVECALPEQFKSVWNGKKFVTVCTDSI